MSGGAGLRRWLRPAPVALVLSVVLAAAVLAAMDLPARWLEPVFVELPLHGPLRTTWADLAFVVPVAEAGRRPELLALGLVLVLAGTAAWGSQQLYRGPARVWAVLATGPIAALFVGRWLRTLPSIEAAFPALPFAILALLAVAATIRPIVHLARPTPGSLARSVACASLATCVDPWPGLGLVVLVLTTTAVHAVQHARRRNDGPSVRWAPALIMGLSPLAFLFTPELRELLVQAPRLRVGLPPLAELGQAIPRQVLYPVLIFPLLLVAPLRWRGGASLVGTHTLALFIYDADSLLTPMPALLAGAATAATGWIWLAGTLFRRRHLTQLSILATFVLVTLGVSGWPLRATNLGWPPQESADLRPQSSHSRVVARSLLAPGDVLLLYEASLARELLYLREREGLRPDCEIVAIAELSPEELRFETLAWATQRRRLLSDSFSLGGLWDPQWAVETGPVFWFLFESAQDLDLMFPPMEVPTQKSPGERGRWTRMQIEHARFARATGDDEAALNYLPLDEDRRREVEVMVRLARAVRLGAGNTSQLSILPAQLGQANTPQGEAAWALAEAGDLLFASGEYERGSELLREAGTAGFSSAWGALARWQMQAGDDRAAARTLEEIRERPSLRVEALRLIHWLSDKHYLREASTLRAGSGIPEAVDPASEIGARLKLLQTNALSNLVEPDH